MNTLEQARIVQVPTAVMLRNWIHDLEDDFRPDVSEGLKGDDPYPYVPGQFKALRRWVVWRLEERDGKSTKVLYDPRTGKRADVTKPETWVDYATACEYAAAYTGIGFVIAPPYVAIDLDKCRDSDTGETEPWAQQVIAELNSYTELSPSGRGVHIWVKADQLPKGRRKAGRIEIYDGSRYFTVTGKCVAGVSTAVEARDLAALHSRLTQVDPAYVNSKSAKSAKPIESAEQAPTPQASTSEPAPSQPAAKSGAKFDALMAGNWEAAGYPSQSEGDSALCVLLAHKHGCDAVKIDAEFRKSGLMREKWEREDYRDQTIQNAIGLVKKNPRTKHGKELVMERFSDIEIKSLSWLWTDRIPAGKLTIFSGNPDVGKSTVAVDLISRYTTGREWPDGAASTVEPGEVLMLLAEDDASDTVKPRLQAAGADMSKIHLIRGVRID